MKSILKAAAVIAATLLLAAPVVHAEPAKKDKKQAAPAGETTLEVKGKLDAFAKAHVNRANDTLKPGRRSMNFFQGKGYYVASFLEVDTDTLTTEIYPSTAPGSAYVGHIVYLEKYYECTGKTKVEAAEGDFKVTRARRIRELTRYDPKKGWIY